jgi:Na+/melibiose symporter-like transporter
MGGLIGFLLPLIISFIPNLSQQLFDALGFIIISILMVILLIIQKLIIKETPSGNKVFEISDNKLELETSTFKVREIKASQTQVKNPMLRAYKDAGLILNRDRDFKFFLFSVILMYLAFASVEAFFSSFAIQFIGITEGEASILFIAYSGPMILAAYPVGYLGQKIGRKKAVKVFLGWMVGSIFIMGIIVVPLIYQNHQPLLVILMLALISIPWMGFITNSFSILWALAPEGETGTYTGIYYTFNQSAYSLAPILFGAILTFFTSFGTYRYIVMFPFILICVILALYMFLKIKGGDVAAKKEMIRKKIEELVNYCTIRSEKAREANERGKCEESIEILENAILEVETARKEILDFAPALTEDLAEQIEMMEKQLAEIRENQ